MGSRVKYPVLVVQHLLPLGLYADDVFVLQGALN